MSTTTSKLTVTTPSEREIVLTREFNAPRQLVFEAYTNPQHVSRWLLGPDGWTMTICEIDLRVGGAWRFGWRGTDGTEFQLHGEYREIVPAERLVYTETYEEHESLETTTFVEENGKTTFTTTILHPSTEVRDGHLHSGMECGVAASYDRLEELLAVLA